MSWPGWADEFMNRLGKIERAGKGWRALCPCHSDHRPSLGIAINGNKILVRCVVCQASGLQIASAVGSDGRHLFADWREKMGNGEGKNLTFVEAYDYRRLDGSLAYQKVRWKREDGSKTFSLRRPTGKPKPNEWEWGGGDERILYRWPELVSAINEKPNRWIFVVEGEKATDFCRQAGLTATCGTGGSIDWHHQNSDAFGGKRVAVIPDADAFDPKIGYAVGMRRAEITATSVYGIAKEVKLVVLPGASEKWGLDDWLASGDKKEQLARLRDLVKTTPEFDPAPNQPRIIKVARAAIARADAEIRTQEEWQGRILKGWLQVQSAIARGGDLESHAIRLAGVLLNGLDKLHKG